MGRGVCLHCPRDEVSSEGINNGEAMLRCMVQVAPFILQAQQADTYDYLRVDIGGYNTAHFFAFIREHLAHGMVLLDENGHTEPLETEEDAAMGLPTSGRDENVFWFLQDILDLERKYGLKLMAQDEAVDIAICRQTAEQGLVPTGTVWSLHSLAWLERQTKKENTR